MKTKLIYFLCLFIIAIVSVACNNEIEWDERGCCPYLFKIEIIKDESHNVIPEKDIFITYCGDKYTIADYKPEQSISYEGGIVVNYGAYYTFKSENKVKICFGEVNLFSHKDCTTQIELHIGDDKHIVNVKYSLDTESVYLYLDGVLVDDGFVTFRY